MEASHLQIHCGPQQKSNLLQSRFWRHISKNGELLFCFSTPLCHRQRIIVVSVWDIYHHWETGEAPHWGAVDAHILATFQNYLLLHVPLFCAVLRPVCYGINIWVSHVPCISSKLLTGVNYPVYWKGGEEGGIPGYNTFPSSDRPGWWEEQVPQEGLSWVWTA